MDYTFPPQRPILNCFGILGMCITGFAIVFAMSLIFPKLWVQTVAGGVYMLWMATIIIYSLRPWFWRRFRGYPFKNGEIVQIISGEFSGSDAYIISSTEGEFSYEVELLVGAAKGKNIWLSSYALRRPGHRIKL